MSCLKNETHTTPKTRATTNNNHLWVKEATRKKKKKTERKKMLANLAFNNCVKIIHFRKNKTQTK